MWLLAVIPGDEPSYVVQGVTVLAPIIAAWITERFTFSQSFLNQIMDLISGQSEARVEIQKQDRRLMPRGTNYLVPANRRDEHK